MLVVRHNIGSIGGKGAVHEFVVIMICLYQMKTEIRIDQLNILAFKEKMDDMSGYFN